MRKTRVVELTDKTTKTPVFINTRHIVCFGRHTDHTYVTLSDGTVIPVIETVESVLWLIHESEE